MGEGSHPERVKVYGPGIEKTGLKANEPTYFTVDCSEAGQGEPHPPGRGLGGRGLDPLESVAWAQFQEPLMGEALKPHPQHGLIFPQAM